MAESSTFIELNNLIIKTNFNDITYCDRGTYLHNYHKAHATLFSDKREDIKNVLEIGIWTGLGLLLWTYYFPNCIVEGIDWKFKWERKIKRLAVSYTHLTLPTTPYV